MRLARSATRLVLGTPLRAPALAMVRGALRSRPDLRLFTAPAFYAGEVLGEEGRHLIGTLRTGSRIHLLAEDVVHRHIYFYGEFEPSTTRFLEAIATPGWTFLDVGANAGYYSLLATDLGGAGSRVLSFEPNPALADLLLKSTSGKPGIEVVRAGCGERAGRGHLTLSDNPANTGLATLRTVVRGPSAVEVPVVTLDASCTERGLVPNVIKIDVEGYEPEVLAGAAGLLGDRVPDYIVCELVPERWEPGPVFRSMEAHGYGVRSLTPEGRLRPYEDRTYQNVVFVRK